MTQGEEDKWAHGDDRLRSEAELEEPRACWEAELLGGCAGVIRKTEGATGQVFPGSA